MGIKLPDVKTVVDSVGDGAVELLETGARIALKEGHVMTDYAASLKDCAEEIKRRLPDDPVVLADAVIRTVGATVKAMVGAGEAVVGGIDETAKGVKSQIERVVK